MSEPFAATLRALRAEAGFGSARAFYKGRGGARALACTYKAYLDVEAGRSTPKPQLALRLAAALGAHADPRRGRRFAEAYLRARLGRGELASLALAALSAQARADPGAYVERAAQRSFAVRPRLPLSRAQADLLCSDPARYWCFTLLLASREPLSAAFLARRLGLAPARVAAALSGLAERELAARRRGGLYACPHVGKLVTYPRRSFYLPDHRAALRAHWGAMAAKRGGVVFERRMGARGSGDGLRRGYPALLTAVYGANILARRAAGPDSALFVVEAVAWRAAAAA